MPFILLILWLLSWDEQLLHPPALQQVAIVEFFTSDAVSLPNKSPCIIIHVFYFDSVPLENLTNIQVELENRSPLCNFF